MSEPLATVSDEQQKAVKEFFDRDVDQYLRERYLTPSCGQLSYLLRKQIVLEMLYGEGGRLLDVGCGPGVFSEELVAMGFRVVSMDLSFLMLQSAREKTALASVAQLHFTQGDIYQLPFKTNSFDCVISIGVLGYLLDPAQGLREIHRILRPGGATVIQMSNRLCPTPYLHKCVRSVNRFIKRSVVGGNELHPFRLTTYSPGRLCRLVEQSGFRIQDQAFYDFTPPFLEKFSASLAMKTASRLQALGRSRAFGWLGEGLLVKMRK